ncbi:MAG: phage holin family protein, partial [Nocardioidaceae bacterium]
IWLLAQPDVMTSGGGGPVSLDSRREPLMTPTTDDPTIGKLVVDASRDVSSLIRNEIALAKSELKISVKAGGTGIALFAGAAFLALLSVIVLSVALAFFLHMTGLRLAWCFLIVAAVYLLVAGLLAFVGLRKVKQVRAPERAIGQAQGATGVFKRG